VFIFCRSGNLTPAINLTSAEMYEIYFQGLGMCVGVVFPVVCLIFFFFNQTPHAYPNTEDVLQDALLEVTSVTFFGSRLDTW